MQSEWAYIIKGNLENVVHAKGKSVHAPVGTAGEVVIIRKEKKRKSETWRSGNVDRASYLLTSRVSASMHHATGRVDHMTFPGTWRAGAAASALLAVGPPQSSHAIDPTNVTGTGVSVSTTMSPIKTVRSYLRSSTYY